MSSFNYCAIELYIYIFYYVNRPDMHSHEWSLYKRQLLLLAVVVLLVRGPSIPIQIVL